MLGWIFDIEGLREILPEQPAMRFNTGLCLTLIALTWFVPRPLRFVGAGIAALVGLTVLGEYAVQAKHGIDQLIVTDHAAVAHPGRMAVASAVSVVLLGGARILIELDRLALARWCGFVVSALAALTLLAEAYDASWLYDIRPVSTVAMHTAAALLLLGLAMLATAPSKQLTRSVQSDDAGAILMRRLLPAALVGLPVVGAVALLGQRHDMYGSTTTAALIVVAGAVVVSLVSWAAAERLSRIDRRRAAAITELTDLKVDLERQVHQRATQLQRRHNEIAVLEDRQRIAADLHDIVIQRLFAAGMFLQGGGRASVDPETQHRLDTAVEAMDAAIRDLRASIFELGGRRELPTDLTTAVDDVCVESARVLGFVPDLIVDDPHYLADQVRVDVLAVLREALANVARHAHASAVEVVLRTGDGMVTLSVTDDGVGMNGTGRASGTRNMLERAREHGGDCTWTPVQPRGTRVRWSLPVEVSVTS